MPGDYNNVKAEIWRLRYLQAQDHRRVKSAPETLLDKVKRIHDEDMTRIVRVERVLAVLLVVDVLLVVAAVVALGKGWVNP